MLQSSARVTGSPLNVGAVLVDISAHLAGLPAGISSRVKQISALVRAAAFGNANDIIDPRRPRAPATKGTRADAFRDKHASEQLTGLDGVEG